MNERFFLKAQFISTWLLQLIIYSFPISYVRDESILFLKQRGTSRIRLTVLNNNTKIDQKA